MRVLILGGTAWLGRTVAAAWVARGADVTCLARGTSGPVAEGARLVVADREDLDAYDAVRDTPWDEVVEISWQPAHVAGALEALAASAAHWTLVSSISVYADHSRPGDDEDAPLVDVVDLTEYSQAKVHAERLSAQILGDRLLVARPGLVVGAGDGSERFGYWVSRFALAAAGPVLVPDATGRRAQVIDVQDLAAWLADAGARRLTGVVDAVGPSLELLDVLDLAATVADFHGRAVVAPDTWLSEREVAPWAGPHSLPLWLPLSHVGMTARSDARFVAAGGRTSPLTDTLARTLADERERGLERERRSGLSRRVELELLAMLDSETRARAGRAG